jgi:3-oxoacyl-[acyl-carrier-protein] synthase-3
MNSIGIRALAVHFPKGRRTNQYFMSRHGDVVGAIAARRKQHVWSRSEAPANIYDEEMEPYLGDPFRGTVERRVLTDGEGSVSLERAAARKVLDAAGLSAKEIDLLVSVSLLPDTAAAANASYLAQDLGTRGMAFNLESACAGVLAALNVVTAMIAAGQCRRALVVSSCTYSRDTDPRDPISWSTGDGAGAMIVGAVDDGLGRLGGKSVHTGSTCGAVSMEPWLREDGSIGYRLRGRPDTGQIIRDVSDEMLLGCCHGALDDARVSLGDIDAFVFNTPVAWYQRYCARALGVDPARSINPYPRYANMGPAILPANLYHSARELSLSRGALVLIYSIGTVSSAGAMVVRWGDVALGPEPEPAQITCD